MANWQNYKVYSEIELKNCTQVMSRETISSSNNLDVTFDKDDNVFCLNPSEAVINSFHEQK